MRLDEGMRLYAGMGYDLHTALRSLVQCYIVSRYGAKRGDFQQFRACPAWLGDNVCTPTLFLFTVCISSAVISLSLA